MKIINLTYDDLHIEWDQSGNVRIVRQSNMQTIELSISEWAFLQKIMELQRWPVARPQQVPTEAVE